MNTSPIKQKEKASAEAFTEETFRDAVSHLNTQIKGLKYLIKMDGVSHSDISNPLVDKLFELENDLTELLNQIREYREAERNDQVSVGDEEYNVTASDA